MEKTMIKEIEEYDIIVIGHLKWNTYFGESQDAPPRGDPSTCTSVLVRGKEQDGRKFALLIDPTLRLDKEAYYFDLNRRCGLQPEDIKYYLLHQANLRIIQAVAKRLKISLDRFPISLDHCGNVSAASVPILLDDVNRKGMLQKGDKIILSGFGGGLTWGTCLIEW